MKRKYPEITFTESVKAAQERYGSRAIGKKIEAWDMDDEHLSEREREFIAARDSFYMASVNEDGWPYLQFRGGPEGFLKVIDDRTLAYADFRGNRQYISMGNLRYDERTALFFMDYAKRERLKLLVRSEVLEAEDHPELLEQVQDKSYKAKIERIVRMRLVAFDWNCPQHITPRFTEAEFAQRQ